jgi:hypothetical protein
MGRLLEELARVLDIPDEIYEDVVAKYRDLGEWLEDEDRELGRRPPEVYTQGSFRLGTMIRPVTDADEYDIDLVYRRDIRRESTTQAQLKREAGDQLRKYIDLKRRQGDGAPELNEGRRCWSLSYRARFHADVLPAIPDPDGRPESLLITDRDLRLWQKSNPIGYAEWFKSRMWRRFVEAHEALAASTHEAVQDVPEWRVKTPLQRAVQLLKRHRDLRFQDDPDDKPASIILTTLAAHAYGDEPDVAEALVRLVRRMPAYIQQRDGTYWVPNPVNLAENFADRWRDSPQRAEKFFRWLGLLTNDVDGLVGAPTIEEAAGLLKSAFGDMAANEALERARAVGGSSIALRESIPPLGDARHCLPPRWLVRAVGKVRVRATVHKARRAGRLWALSPRPVPKDLWLRFEAETNVAPPYDVHWQVVNTGGEAHAAGDLRGGFYSGNGTYGSIRWESTRYRGRHWLEAFVVKDGICVARSGRIGVSIS